jgi:signal transduction histidine kinase
VRRIARAHGGRVEVSSSPGAGSTFTIHLPLNPLG